MLLLKPYLLSCTPFDVWSHDALNVAFMIVMITIAWLIPLTTITGCYCKVTYIQKKKDKRHDNKFKEVEGFGEHQLNIFKCREDETKKPTFTLIREKTVT